ncbi:hypothetical protein BST61_g11493 [Cercospora zeina]
MDETSSSTTRTRTSVSAQRDGDKRDDNERELDLLLTRIRHLEASHNCFRDYLLALGNARDTLDTSSLTPANTAMSNLARKHIIVEELARIACSEAASALECAVRELKLHLRIPENAAPSESEQRDQLAYAALLRRYTEGHVQSRI